VAPKLMAHNFFLLFFRISVELVFVYGDTL